MVDKFLRVTDNNGFSEASTNDMPEATIVNPIRITLYVGTGAKYGNSSAIPAKSFGLAFGDTKVQTNQGNKGRSEYTHAIGRRATPSHTRQAQPRTPSFFNPVQKTISIRIPAPNNPIHPKFRQAITKSAPLSGRFIC